MNYENPVINGDGNFSRDFTYIDNVIQMNELAMLSKSPESNNTVYNTAYGDRTTLNELVHNLKNILSKYDSKIHNVEIIHGPNRLGDIPHSLASIDKAKSLLNYSPKYNLFQGLESSIEWYWKNLR
jgi:UDP-N-acetylglucosamine 4-epimerase